MPRMPKLSLVCSLGLLPTMRSMCLSSNSTLTGEQTSLRRVDRRDGSSKGEGKRSVTWYIDGGIARNCDVKLCCPGVTLNVSPVLQSRVTVLDCVFPMSMDRFVEIQRESRLDVLHFTSDDHFDVRPETLRDAERNDQFSSVSGGLSSEVHKAPLSRNPSVASLTLSRDGSTADLQSENLCKKSSSYNLLAGLASALGSKMQPARSRSTVLAWSAQERWWINFSHSSAMRLVRCCLALALWGNRVAEWMVYKHTAKLSTVLVLVYLVRRRARKTSWRLA